MMSDMIRLACPSFANSASASASSMSHTPLPNPLRLSDPLAQTINVLAFATYAEERPRRIGTLLQHLANCEQLAAQLLCRPGQEQLGLDQTSAKKRTDRLVQFGNVILVDGAHHDALGELCT